MICVPAVPDACANEYGPRYVSQCTSPPWVVKSIDGSSDCGNVPATTVATVALLLVVDDEVVFDDEAADDDVAELELFELPQAASAITTASARTLAAIGLVSFFMLPPPQKVVSTRRNLLGDGTSRRVPNQAATRWPHPVGPRVLHERRLRERAKPARLLHGPRLPRDRP